jgi:hypothetical protein
LAAAPLCAAPVIEGGTYYLQPGLTGQVLAVTVSGGDAVPGVEFYVQIGDGGAANGGTDTAPAIAAIDLVGTGMVFHDAAGSNPRSNGPLIWMDDVVIPDTIPPTVPPPTVPAAGTLATVTINTTGAAGGSYALRLQGVNTLDYPGGLSTHFTPFGPTPTIHDGRIVILHPMTWNKAGPGAWTESQWSGTPPSYPDDSAETIINTAYTVNLIDAQQTYTLAVSNGELSISAAGSLTAIGTVTLGTNGTLTLAPGAGLTAPGVQLSGGTLAVSGGAYSLTAPVSSAGGTLSTAVGGDSLTLGGLLTAAAGSTLNKTGSGTVNVTGGINHAGAIVVQGGLLKYNLTVGKPVTIGSSATLSIASGATVELAGALSGTSDATNRVAVTNDSTAGGLRILPGTNQVLGAIGGSGKTSVLAGANLTADSIVQDTLEIGAGGSLVIRESTGAASSMLLGGSSAALSGGSVSVSSSGGTQAVPEPGVLVLLLCGLLPLAGCAWRKRR